MTSYQPSIDVTCITDRDGTSPADGWPLPHMRVVKVFLPLFDVDITGGPSAVVPRTHRLQEKPQEVARFQSQGGLQVDTVGYGTVVCSVSIFICNQSHLA